MAGKSRRAAVSSGKGSPRAASKRAAKPGGARSGGAGGARRVEMKRAAAAEPAVTRPAGDAKRPAAAKAAPGSAPGLREKLKLNELTPRLADLAGHYDLHSFWPQRSLDLLAAAGGWRWGIPQAHGGAGLDNAGLLAAYEAVARGCLTTALILTQRDGACDLIASGANEGLKQRLLPAYARGERFTSIGIAQLTTSQRGGKPQLVAQSEGRGLVLDGIIPWVTAAPQCDEIVTGAVLADGRQVVACVSCEDAGVMVEPPMQLMAVSASATSRVRCKAAKVPAEMIVRGPVESVLAARAPVKPLVVSAVGMGVAGSIVDRIEGERVAPELKEPVAALRRRYGALRAELARAAEQVGAAGGNEVDRRVGVAGGGEVDPRGIRVRVNDLVVKLALAYLTIGKGTGYTRPHPAERLLREAMLFLVWSAPLEVQQRTLALIASSEEHGE